MKNFIFMRLPENDIAIEVMLTRTIEYNNKQNDPLLQSCYFAD